MRAVDGKVTSILRKMYPDIYEPIYEHWAWGPEIFVHAHPLYCPHFIRAYHLGDSTKGYQATE